MEQNRLKHLSSSECETLFEDLHVLTMLQLRGLCKRFNLDSAGKKLFLIEVLKQYLTRGIQLQPEVYPTLAYAVKGQKSELHSDAPILLGSYKSDLRTRLFMKQLAGDRFHYTAAGLDWIHERWMAGKPPTYAEYALWWKTEGQLKRPLKKEWAFLNFVAQHQEASGSKAEVMRLWKQHQAATYARVQKILSSL